MDTEQDRLSKAGTARQNFNFEKHIGPAREGAFTALRALKAALWSLEADGHLTAEQCQYLVDGIIEARLRASRDPDAPKKQRSPDSYVGTRPISSDSLKRRRRLSRDNWVLPDDGEDLTNGMAAVLAIYLEEIMKFGRCTLPVGKIAALAGISRRWAQICTSTLITDSFLSIEHRPRDRRRHDTNVVTIAPGRDDIRGRVQARKKWWRGRGPLIEIGRTLGRATRLKSSYSIPHMRDNSVSPALKRRDGAAEGQRARNVPPRPMREAPG